MSMFNRGKKGLLENDFHSEINRFQDDYNGNIS